jgi:hypothetical protein
LKLYLINDDGDDYYVAADYYFDAVSKWQKEVNRIDEEPEHISLLCGELIQ